MAGFRPIRVLGLMSGTSMDGVDGAILRTDGDAVIEPLWSGFHPYSDAEREVLRAAQGLWPGDGDAVDAARRIVEKAHVSLIETAPDVDLVGFHGQTLAHDPANGRTHQTGDGTALAVSCNLPVAWDFRSADLEAGGEGAPLAPFYHHAIAREAGLTEPVAILNLGGVGNVTWIDPAIARPDDPHALLAFDTGPANAPIDDLMLARTGEPVDMEGKMALSGKADQTCLERRETDTYFDLPPPKSLDRASFADLAADVASLSTPDAAATLTEFVAISVTAARPHFPRPATRWFVAGGGRKNPALMAALARRISERLQPIEALGRDGDMIEAEAFAYLAARTLRGLPLSSPSTTGCATPCFGGRLSHPDGLTA